MATPNFSELEQQILQDWKQKDVFKRTLAKPAPKGRFVFFEGPPTANGMPHIGHVETRAFKDIIPRFKTMQGYLVERKAGWDTQGFLARKILRHTASPPLMPKPRNPSGSIRHCGKR